SAFLSIGELARRCGISRTTVLYYEAAGLIAAASRSAAGYRRYTDTELARLRQICAWRAAGLGVAAIASLQGGGDRPALLRQRLDEIGRDMAHLREQQAVLVRLLHGGPAGATMDKAGWTALLRATGLDDADMARWHALFERQNPQAHHAFLLSLGIGADEAARIRAACKNAA
ncbi:MAG: MerR family transcriptional regulator, partial [Telluria sp.]|nr:MerR family transcriptional regulator [Telluria sp.]